MIEDLIRWMFEKMVVNDEMYQHYLLYAQNQIWKKAEENRKKMSRLNLRLSNVKSERDKYVKTNMWFAKDEDEKRIYENMKKDFNDKIDYLMDELQQQNQTERDEILEFEVFLRLLKKAPQLFEKATYVQKATITNIFVSNIVVSPWKPLKLKVKPILSKLFNGNVEMTGLEPVSEREIIERLPTIVMQ